MPDSVPRKLAIQMLMVLADGLGLGTYSTYYLFLVTLTDAPIAPCLKQRMVNLRVSSMYSGQP